MSDKDRAVTNAGTATANFFAKYGAAATQRAIVGQLLRFNKFGEWHYGLDDEELPRGTQRVVHMMTTTVGWQKWVDNRPAQTVMGLLAEGFEPPPRSSLGDNDPNMWETYDDGRPRDPWQFTNTVILSDPRDHELYTYSTTSRGGLTAVGELSKAFSDHLRIAPDEMPLVALEVGSYQHPNKSYGEIRFPRFVVAGWVPSSQLPSTSGDMGAAQALPAPEEPESPPAPKPANNRKAKSRIPF
jgi:hypothetical protein